MTKKKSAHFFLLLSQRNQSVLHLIQWIQLNQFIILTQASQSPLRYTSPAISQLVWTNNFIRVWKWHSNAATDVTLWQYKLHRWHESRNCSSFVLFITFLLLLLSLTFSPSSPYNSLSLMHSQCLIDKYQCSRQISCLFYTHDIAQRTGSFRCIRKIAKLASPCRSLRLSMCTEQLGSHWTDFHEIWLSVFSKICPENSSFIKIWEE